MVVNKIKLLLCLVKILKLIVEDLIWGKVGYYLLFICV